MTGRYHPNLPVSGCNVPQASSFRSWSDSPFTADVNVLAAVPVVPSVREACNRPRLHRRREQPRSGADRAAVSIMTIRPLILCFSMVLLSSVPVLAGSAKEPGINYPLQYQGGSLPLRQNHGVKAVFATRQLVFMQNGQRFVVPATSISEIAYGSDVRRRFGAVILGLVPLVDLDKVEENYVSLTWTTEAPSNGMTGSGTVLFKLNSGEYREFLAALERLTGKKAVDTKKTATVVHYDL